MSSRADRFTRSSREVLQLDIWYAKHPPKRKLGPNKGSPGNADDSDEERGCQRRKVYHDSASDEDHNADGDVNGGDYGAAAAAAMGGCD
jgi:hypothetical protein